jgi:hypothetical protein
VASDGIALTKSNPHRSGEKNPLQVLRFAERAAKRKRECDMGQIVKCDICGKIYNESNLTTHKRRSHGTPGAAAEGRTESVDAILSIYERLPEERKKEVLNRLAAREQTKK